MGGAREWGILWIDRAGGQGADGDVCLALFLVLRCVLLRRRGIENGLLFFGLGGGRRAPEREHRCCLERCVRFSVTIMCTQGYESDGVFVPILPAAGRTGRVADLNVSSCRILQDKVVSQMLRYVSATLGRLARDCLASDIRANDPRVRVPVYLFASRGTKNHQPNKAHDHLTNMATQRQRKPLQQVRQTLPDTSARSTWSTLPHWQRSNVCRFGDITGWPTPWGIRRRRIMCRSFYRREYIWGWDKTQNKRDAWWYFSTNPRLLSGAVGWRWKEGGEKLWVPARGRFGFGLVGSRSADRCGERS